MKFAVLLAAAAGAGALAVVAVPATLVRSASDGVHEIADRSGFAQFRLANLNPLRAVFDYEQKRIQTPMTPEELGIRTSTIKFTPITLPPPPSLKLDLGRAFDAQAGYEIQRNNQRMEDLRNYGRDPAHWIGPPPN